MSKPLATEGAPAFFVISSIFASSASISHHFLKVILILCIYYILGEYGYHLTLTPLPVAPKGATAEGKIQKIILDGYDLYILTEGAVQRNTLPEVIDRDNVYAQSRQKRVPDSVRSTCQFAHN